MDVIQNYLTHCVDLSMPIKPGFNLGDLIICFYIFIMFIVGFALIYLSKLKKGILSILTAIVCIFLLSIMYNNAQIKYKNDVKQVKIARQTYNKSAHELMKKYPNMVILHTQKEHWLTNAQTTILFTKHTLSDQELNDYARGKSIDLSNDDQVICQFDPNDLTDKESIKFPNQYRLNDYKNLQNTKTSSWIRGITKELK